MSLFTTDERCIKCGICSQLCLAGIIKTDKEKKPYVPANEEKMCIECGQCVAFCPKSCCYLSFQSRDERTVTHADELPPAKAMEAFLRSRRSIRSYDKQPIDEVTVRRLIETARYAPSARNSQPVRWIVVNGREKVLEIGDIVADAFIQFADQNPVDSDLQAIKVIGQTQKSRLQDIIFRGAPQLAVAIVDRNHSFPEDGAIALTYFELAAHANGIGCCWAGFFTMAARKSEAIGSALKISADEFVVGAQMFGYPQGIGAPHMLPPRKKPDISFISE